MADSATPDTGLIQEALVKRLTSIVGASNVRRDDATRKLFSQDIWLPAGELVDLVVSPSSLEELQSVMAVAHKAGAKVAPRGAGMSYTGGYVPSDAGTISLDMARMNRILSVSREDMTVTVEAGVTWKALNDALAPLGLRTPFWGPMSGLKSTIGGGVSQLNAMFGAAHHGTSSESVIAMTIVGATGKTIRTGARGVGGEEPFYRHFGPDITGLFCGDCGVLGVKAEITLRLMTAPDVEAQASFSFPSGPELLKAMAELTRAGVACEICAFDPGLTKIRLKRASLSADVKTLGSVVSKEKSLIKGLMSASKIAMSGRNFVEPDDYPLHVICEGRSEAAVDADMKEARRIVSSFGGKEIENSIAKILRSMPFPALNSMVGPTGEAWVPIHGVCSLKNAPEIFKEIQSVYAAHADEMSAQDVHPGFLFTSMSTNALIIEPVFFWPQGWREIHEEGMEASHTARLTQRPENPEATALVKTLRAALLGIFQKYGCGHFQIGRTYPYIESRDDASVELLEAVKAVMDPEGALNPGVLGLPVKGGQA
ncbi:FAD-binding oxidoreductase [Henriciella sp. AS95]|uniref:FAD-binding oxidoreductase n=1 Tax=Henriciella sp. AS95 TaxID=3135782 RepID=UPI003172C8DA